MNFVYLLSKVIKKIQIPALKNSGIDKTSRVCSASHIIDTNIKRYSYVGSSCTIINTNIGSFCSIADNCIVGGASHPIEWISTSPVFHNGKNIMRKNFSTHEYKTVEKTVIGNDVWIGNNCLIKSGVEIKDGAIIGMGSVLTKNVGAYEIWAGNPARLIRKRFDDFTIEKIRNSNWWEWDNDALTEKSLYFNDVEKFFS